MTRILAVLFLFLAALVLAPVTSEAAQAPARPAEEQADHASVSA
jgi:hypothetical protein